MENLVQLGPLLAVKAGGSCAAEGPTRTLVSLDDIRAEVGPLRWALLWVMCMKSYIEGSGRKRGGRTGGLTGVSTTSHWVETVCCKYKDWYCMTATEMLLHLHAASLCKLLSAAQTRIGDTSCALALALPVMAPYQS